MVKQTWLRKRLLLLPAAWLLGYAAAGQPLWVEKNYTTGVYPLFAQPLSTLSGFLPFSLAELILACLVLVGIFFIGRGIHVLLAGSVSPAGAFRRLLMPALLAAGLVYLGFVLGWGLNYYRLPFAQTAHFDVHPSSIGELAAASRAMIHWANRLRGELVLSGQVPGTNDPADIFRRAGLGYQAAARKYPALGGSFGPPKPVFLSRAMTYTGITGVYFPFTGEANVNTHIPPVTLPFTAGHEMAHQRGFAREDEANFIAYLTCRANPGLDFQYSGSLMAVIYLMNALTAHDPEAAAELRQLYGDGLRQDLAAISAFWRRYQGPVEQVSTRVNDIFLKSSRQKDGVQSYNRVVDLLLADHRQNALW